MTSQAGNLTVTGGVSGTGNLILSNNGSTSNGITLSTTAVNNTGTITNSGSGSGGVSITGGVGANVTGITQNSTTSGLTISTGALTVNSGGKTLTSQAGNLTVSGGLSGTGNLTLKNDGSTANGITLSITTINNTGTITNSGSGTGGVTISAAIGTNVNGLTQNSATSSLTLSGNNTYTGGTTISAGTLMVGHASGLGANTSTVSVSNGAALDLNGTTMTNTNALTLNGAGSGSGGILNSSDTGATYAGAINMGSGSTIGSTGTGNTFILSGGVTSTGTGNLTIKVGGTQAITLSTTAVNNTGTISNSGSGTGLVSITGGVGANVTGITQNSATSGLSISTGALTVNSGGKTLTSQAGNLTVSGGVSGTGNLILKNDGSTDNGITLSTTTVNNTGTITNSGSGTGGVTISAPLGTNVTAIIQDSATSNLTLSSATNNSSGFSSNITIKSGAVIASTNNGSLGAGTIFLGDTTGTATAALLGATDARTWANNIIVQANPDANINIIGNNAAVTPVFSGLITLNDDVKISATGASGGVTLNGAVNAAALTGAGNVTFSGGSGTTFTLGGNNTNFTGSVLLTGGGTLKNNSYQALGAFNTVSIAAGSTYVMNGYYQTIGGLNDITNFTGGNVSNTVSTSTPLTIAGSGSYTFSGAISGNMSLVKSGSGTQALSGNNSYNGNTTISGGTLQVSGSGVLGAGNYSASIINSAAFVYSSSGNQILGGVISGSGALTKDTSSASTLTLAGSNTYSGATTVSAGTLSLTGNLSSSNVTVNGGMFNQSSTGGIAGTGTTFTVSSGNATLAGTNTYTGATTINGGTLAVSGGSAIVDTGTVTLANTAGAAFNVNGSETIASLQGGGWTGGNVSIATGQTLTVAEANTNTFAGSLQGAGHFTHSGTGTLTLSGTNTNTGAISVSASGGALVLSGAGALSGNTSLLSGAFGTSISLVDNTARTQSVAGGLSLTNSKFTFDLNGSTADRLDFTGAATLSGTNTINLNFINPAVAQTYTLFTASSGLNGGAWSLDPTVIQSGFTFTLNSTATALNLVVAASSNPIFYWTGNASSAWSGNNFSSSGSDYSGSSLNATSDVVFAAAGAGNLSTTLGTTYNVNTLSVSTPAVSISGGNITANSTSATTYAVLATSGTTTISSNLTSPSGGFSKTGAGTLILSGSNTYGGNTTLSAGTLAINSASAIGNGTLIIADGASLDTTVSSTTLTKNNTQRWNGDFTFVGTNNSSLNMGTGAVTIAQNGLVVTTSAGNLTVGGVIGDGGSAYGLTKAGNGTLVLTGANTYTGATTINAGTLSVSTIGNGGASSALGASSNASSNLVLGGGTLLYTGSNATTDRNITLSAGTTSSFNVTNSTAALTLNGTFASTSGGFAKEGSGTLLLSGASGFTGDVFINNGTLRLNTANSGYNTALGNYTVPHTVYVNSGANLTFGATNWTPNGNTGIAIALVVNGTVSGAGSNISTFGPVTMNGGNMSVANGQMRLGNSTFNVGGSAASRMFATGSNSFDLLTTVNFNVSDATSSSAADLIVSAPIASTGNLTKSGLGTMQLSGANTFSGIMTISAGTLQYAKNTSLYNAVTANWTASKIKVANAATMALNVGGTGEFTTSDISTLLTNLGGANGGSSAGLAAGAILAFDTTNSAGNSFTIADNITNSSGSGGGAINLTKLGTNTLALSSANTYTGTTTITAGTLQISSAGVLGGGSYGGNISNSGAFVYSSSANQTLSGVLSGPDSLTKDTSASSTLTLSGNNTYTGATAVNTGVLNIQHANALGTTAGGTTVASGAALQLQGVSIGPEALNLSGTGVNSDGALRNISGTNSYAGAITLGAASRINSDADLLTLTGGLTGTNDVTFGGSGDIAVNTGAIATSTGGLTKDGSGTLTLSAANTYSGGTTLNTGTLNINNASAIGSGTLTINGGTLNNTSGNAITLSTNNAQALNGDFAFTGTNDLNLGTGAVTMNASRVITVNGGNLTIGGAIAGSGIGLTKNGSGTLTLAGNNTALTGATTINSGTLAAAASGALGGTSSIDLNGGSFLVTADNAVNDSADINLNGGTLAVSGTFNENVGLLTLSANSVIDLDNFTGILRFSGVGSWAANTTLAIWNWNGINQYGTPVGDGFSTRHVVFASNSGLSNYLDRISFYSGSGTGFSGNAFESSFSQSGFTGSEIIAVPEPEAYATAALLLLGSAVYFIFLKRKISPTRPVEWL